MPEKQIYILAKEPEQANLLTDLFAQDHFEAQALRTISELSEKIDPESFFICLIDYPTLLTAEREEVVNAFRQLKNNELIVFNVPENASRRLAFYDLGARRVYDLSHSVEEMYFSISWMLKIASQDDDTIRHSRGRLRDLPLHVLIPIIASEERSGILTVHSQNSSGKIFFFEGNIIDARIGSHHGSAALYHMFLWKEGNFAFAANPHIKVKNQIGLSNFGLLIQAQQCQAEFELKMDELAPPDAIIRVTHTGDLEASDIEIDPDFIRYLKRPHHLREIIENPFYLACATLEKLIELKINGFIQINEPVEAQLIHSGEDATDDGTKRFEMSDTEFETFSSHLELQDEDQTKLIILSNNMQSRIDFIESLAGGYKTGDGEAMLEIGKVQINDAFLLYLIGLELNQLAAEAISKIFGGMAGYVFILDARQTDKFEYFTYVIKQILNANPLPSVVVLQNLLEEQTIQSVRSAFQLPEELTWIEDRGDLKQILLSITPFEAEEEEENVDVELTETASDENPEADQ